MRKDYKKLLVIGSGPIVIGQAAEFDFSGSQACRSLREEGYKTVLVNSNPATIQTDPDTADSVYIEPLDAANVARIIAKEGVDGVVSGMGGQTALNICSELADSGELKRLGAELVGTQPDAIAMSEDRELFKETMERIGEPVPVSRSVNSIEEAKEAVRIIGRYPVLIRPAYTLGGTGGGIAYNEEELEDICARGLAYSRIHQVLIEESVLGWKEYEYEVMRDAADNCIIICNMENLDAMGIHTGESIVVAPCLTLSDHDHQRLRTAALKVIRALGIEGGCNVQFAFNPAKGDYRLIEVNPRVSRSSALASKATGYPIARVATKIAVGYTLDEIPNKITGTTYAAFEPLTLGDVLNVIEAEDADGVIVQYGGQTSVNLAVDLERALAGTKTRILGTSPDKMDVAEDRRRFSKLMDQLQIKQPASGTGYSFEEAKEIAEGIGYPVLVRPSYVLGGRAMEIVYSTDELKTYVETAVKVSRNHPILIDKYLTEAIEIDVDCVCDGTDVYIGGIMEHVEYAGCHSGDATMVLPPFTLKQETIDEIVAITEKVALALEIKGLMNLQLAVKDGQVFMIEANPRASRTVPFISKATGIPLAKIGVKIMLGKTLKDFGLKGYRPIDHYAVKASVFPFLKLPGVDSILTPEMKSTGEVMGIDEDFHTACYKALIAAGNKLPASGGVYITVNDRDKPRILAPAKELKDMGFTIYATKGTSTYLREHGIENVPVFRLDENQKPNAVGLMRDGEINLVINTPTQTSGPVRDGYTMRRLAVELEIPFMTTVQGAEITVGAIKVARSGKLGVRSMKEFHGLRD